MTKKIHSSTFGLYKAGGLAYDRAIYLSLYNGEKETTHTTKKYKYKILKPRLSLYAAGHTHKIVSTI
jgi:hypothetical protein